MSAAIELLSGACLGAGGLFVIVGCLGLIRMPDVYTRMHSASVTDTLGAALLITGLVLQAGVSLISAKLIVLGLLIFFTSPTATHALAKAVYARGLAPGHSEAEDVPSSR